MSRVRDVFIERRSYRVPTIILYVWVCLFMNYVLFFRAEILGRYEPFVEVMLDRQTTVADRH